MLRQRGTLLCLTASLGLLAGCGPFFGLPSICEPGSESEKLARAKKFDPYPDPNMGPAVVGGRPEGFMNPRPDPDLTKRSALPWAQSYPPVAASYPPVSYPATGSYYPSANVVAPPATTAYPPASAYVAPASPYIAPANASAAPAAVPALVPLGPSPAAASSPENRTTGVPPSSYGPSAAPVAYGTKLTAP